MLCSHSQRCCFALLSTSSQFPLVTEHENHPEELRVKRRRRLFCHRVRTEDTNIHPLGLSDESFRALTLKNPDTSGVCFPTERFSTGRCALRVGATLGTAS